MSEADEHPDIFAFDVNGNEKGKIPDQLWNEAVKPILDLLATEGWDAVRNRWDSYSVISYLTSTGLSRAAIDYISLMSNLESIRDTLLLGKTTKFYRLQGGSDLLIKAMINECLSIEGGLCSLLLNTTATQVQLQSSEQIRVISSTTDNLFNSLIVVTSNTAVQLIDFDNREYFSDKYRAMR